MNTTPTPWLPVFDDWSDGSEPILDRALVHKAQAENVLISRLAAVGPDRFAVQFRFALDHPFFFEHDCDHVPGLALLEGARQAGIAICHEWYGVPFSNNHFLLQGLQSRFTRFAELDAPVFGEVRVADVRTKRGQVVGLTCHGTMAQRGRCLGGVRGDWSIVSSAVQARIRGAA